MGRIDVENISERRNGIFGEKKKEKKKEEKKKNSRMKSENRYWKRHISYVRNFFFLLRPVFSLFYTRERFFPWLLELTCKTLANIGKHAWLNRLSGLLVLDSSLCLFSTHLPSFLASLLSTFFFLKRIFSRTVLRVLRITRYIVRYPLSTGIVFSFLESDDLIFSLLT